MLNAAILLILVSCLMASFVTESVARKMALQEQMQATDSAPEEEVLIALANPTTDTTLVDMAIFSSEQSQKSHLSVLAVSNNSDDMAQQHDKLLHAARYATSADRHVEMLTQVAANTANGILQVAESKSATRLVIGLNINSDTNTGDVATHLIGSFHNQLLLYRQVQPLNTIERLRVAVPNHAEQESGFLRAFDVVRNLALQTSARVSFYCNQQSQIVLNSLCHQPSKKLTAQFVEMTDWEDSLMIAKEMGANDMLILLLARPDTLSYNPLFSSTPYLIQRFYMQYNVLIVYPEQQATATTDSLLQDHYSSAERMPLVNRIYNRYLTWHRRKQRIV